MAVSLKPSLRTIWRVENEEGVGPFHDDKFRSVFRDYQLQFLARAKETPLPQADFKLKKAYISLYKDADDFDDWFYGFYAAEQFNIWFGDQDIQEILACADFSLQKYLIDPQFVHEGTNQCMFWRPAALQCFDS